MRTYLKSIFVAFFCDSHNFVKRLNTLSDRHAVQVFAQNVATRASRTFAEDQEFKEEAKKLTENMAVIAQYLGNDWVKVAAR